MFNRYAYALNNPSNLTDANGECPICIPIAIFIIKELAAEGASQATGGATDFLSVRRSGTKAAKYAAKKCKAGDIIAVAGGGDTVAAMVLADVVDDFTFVSTAGGAFLEWMEGKALPGVDILKNT